MTRLKSSRSEQERTKAIRALTDHIARQSPRARPEAKLHELAARPGSTFMLVHISGNGRFVTRFNHRPVSLVGFLKPAPADRKAITTWFRGLPEIGDILVDPNNQWLLIAVSIDKTRVEQVARAQPTIPDSFLISLKRNKKGT